MSLEMLRTATERLLKSDQPAVIHLAIDTLQTLFSEITMVRADILQPQHSEQTFLDGGVAISPNLAAQCLLDPLRTVQFLRGIHMGIHEAMRRFPGERIHIVYAGCGPYATLLLPLTTRFTPEQIQLTLIDLHKPSVDGVQQIIEAFELDNYVHQCVQANAITYQLPPDMPCHMVVSETMQMGLADEPQFAIMRNFLPQLKENGIFIPEKIVVAACLSSSEEEDIGLLMQRDEFGYPVGRKTHMDVERVPLGQIISLDAEFVNSDKVGCKWDAIPLTTIRIPLRDERLDQFLLITAVSIFDAYGFAPYDCELSFPLRISDLTDVKSGTDIRFSYEFGRDPGLKHELLSTR